MSMKYFKVRPAQRGVGISKLIRLFSYGNDKAFTKIFNNPESCRIKTIGPLIDAQGYMGYQIKYFDENGKVGGILLNTSTEQLPWGVGRSLDSESAYIFNVGIDETLEVFVFPGQSHRLSYLMTSVQNGTGTVMEEIDALMKEIATMEAKVSIEEIGKVISSERRYSDAA